MFNAKNDNAPEDQSEALQPQIQRGFMNKLAEKHDTRNPIREEELATVSVTVRPASPPVVALKDLANICHCSTDAVKDFAKLAGLSFVKIGRSDVTPWADFLDAVRTLGAPTPSQPRASEKTPKKGADTAAIAAANGFKLVSRGAK